MSRWLRKGRCFAAGAIALALLLASQLIVTSAISSQMEAADLLFNTAEGQVMCLSEHSQARDIQNPQIAHKTTCDICAFAAHQGTAPAPHFALLRGIFLHAAETPLPRAMRETCERHEPRVTRGPPRYA